MTEPVRISDEKARQILQRAAELDRSNADLVSIDTLREAAKEAGIAESSFAAALRESTEAPHRARRLTRRDLIAGVGAIVALAVIMLLGRLFAPTRAPAPVLTRDTPIAKPDTI